MELIVARFHCAPATRMGSADEPGLAALHSSPTFAGPKSRQRGLPPREGHAVQSREFSGTTERRRRLLLLRTYRREEAGKHYGYHKQESHHCCVMHCRRLNFPRGGRSPALSISPARAGKPIPLKNYLS